METNTLEETISLTMKSLAFNVRTARKSRKMTQAQLAERAGVSRFTIIKIEAGVSNPDLSNLIQIAGVLEIPLDRLLRPEAYAAELRERMRLVTKLRLVGA